MLKNAERKDFLPGCNYAIWQAENEFAFTTDTVFLAAFAHLAQKARVLDLGCGTGAIALLLAARGAQQVVAADNNPHVIELLRRSIADNALGGIVSAETIDLRNLRDFQQAESFDLVLANPPYRNGGKQRHLATAACHELTTSLADFFAAAAYFVKCRGRFALVQLPERFAECMELALGYGLQPKKLQWVHAAVNKPAWIFLMEMVKGGKYGLEVLPPLIMYKADGSLSEGTLEYYNASAQR